MRQTYFGLALLAAVLLSFGPLRADAATSPKMKACAEEWKADKAAGKVAAGMTWSQFSHECAARGDTAGAPAAAPAAATGGAVTAAPPAATATEPAAGAPVAPPSGAKQPSAGQAAMHARQKQCGAEWRAAKAAGKIQAGMTWPTYWHDCNTRLKAAAG